MITEKALLNILALEVYTGVWKPITADLRSVSIQRGGKRRGITNTVEVGTLACSLVNTEDPLKGGTLKPNQAIRLKMRDTPRGHFEPQPPVGGVPQPDRWVEDPPLVGTRIWSGLINDVDASYLLNKSTNKLTTIVSITAVDAVAAHASITRYGAVVEGGAGFETWAQRITRLASSAVTPVTVPVDDAPIVRYSI